MSLLMDALKRAEASKQEAASKMLGKSPPDMLSLEPLPENPATGTGRPLPDLASHIEAVDADLATTPADARAPFQAAPRPNSPETRNAQADREAVRNAFAAKQMLPTPATRNPLWLLLGLLGLAALGIGAYFWYQLQQMNHGGLAPNSPPPEAPLGQARPASPPPPAPLEPPIPAPGTTNNPEVALFTPQPRPAPVPAPVAAENQPGVPIRLTRTRPEPDANLQRGHDYLERNELDLARHDYEQTLRREPNNTDALLALAAIAQRQGRQADAERLRQRALVANPSDSAVQAASLSGSAGNTDPQTTESRLKTLLAAQPESAPLNFALGNLYARQKRWDDAQQVYFNAVAAEGDNPDYLFNLAVSLDHLRQNRLAAQHYRLAIDAAEHRPAAFDREQARKRLLELQP